MKLARRQQTITSFATLLVWAGIVLSGCEENLPAYEQPEIELAASIYVEIPVDLREGPPDRFIGMDITNVTGADDPTEQAEFRPPYEVKAYVTVYRADSPNRKIDVEADEAFTDPVADVLQPGRTIRVQLPFPMEDRAGHAWNWPELDEGTGPELIVQGSATILEEGLILHTEPVRTTLIYP
jgi:hypothetical protein